MNCPEPPSAPERTEVAAPTVKPPVKMVPAARQIITTMPTILNATAKDPYEQLLNDAIAKKGHPHQARMLLERAATLSPEDPRTMETWGHIFGTTPPPPGWQFHQALNRHTGDPGKIVGRFMRYATRLQGAKEASSSLPVPTPVTRQPDQPAPPPFKTSPMRTGGSQINVKRIGPVENRTTSHRTLTQIIQEREEALRKSRGNKLPTHTPDGRPIYHSPVKQSPEERARLRKILEGKE